MDHQQEELPKPRPMVLRLLEGVRYGAVWNKKGGARQFKPWAKHCRRIMAAIPTAFSQPTPGAVAFEPWKRHLETEGQEVAQMVALFCSHCHLHTKGFCKGVTL